MFAAFDSTPRHGTDVRPFTALYPGRHLVYRRELFKRRERHQSLLFPLWNVAQGDATTVLHSVTELLENISAADGPEQFATRIVRNEQRTSPRGGILKAEAVYRIAQVFQQHQIERLDELPRFGAHRQMEVNLRNITGQRSGVSLKYLFMLTGDVSLVKPDRMTRSFLEDTLGRAVSDDDIQCLLSGACQLMNEDFPALTPRGLDHQIWQYERNKWGGR